MRVDVALLPPAAAPPGTTCLVVDVLRATSVMAVLFGRGVQAVWPASSIETGRDLHAALSAGSGDGAARRLLCGERDAMPPAGYDYGNSPLEFERIPLTSEVVMATTNGTPAFLACAQAALVMPAAPLNAAAAVRTALAAGHDVLVVCAGLRGAVAEDDTIAAGLLVDRLVRAGARPGDEALHALGLYEAVRDELAAGLRATEHGRTLVEMGFGDDVDRCAQEDAYTTVAALGFEAGRAVLRPLAV